MRRTFLVSFLFILLGFFIGQHAFAAQTNAPAELKRNLNVGTTGSDVSAIQSFLASVTSYYPEGKVTGYFGKMTSAAVSRFQVINGLPSTGTVGPKTRALLSTLLQSVSGRQLLAGVGATDATKLSGTKFGTGPSYMPGTEYDKATDGNTNTYFDDVTASGGYTGIDLGAGNERQIAKIRFAPRGGANDRMNGGKFQGSNTSQDSGYVDLYTISGNPKDGWNEVVIPNTSSFRYLRYVGPINGYTNIAEVEFYANVVVTPTPAPTPAPTTSPSTNPQLSGSKFGTGPSYMPGTEYDKATDGNTDTYFDDSTASGGYTGIDLGAGIAQQITKIRFFPRAAANDRMNGGKFQGSNTSQNSGFVDLYTINGVPNAGWNEVTISNTTSFRYLRYVGPTNGYTNIAEVEFYGFTPTSVTPPAPTPVPPTPTPIPTPAPSTAQRDFITGQTLNTPRNNYSGEVGMKFTTGANPVTVTDLGRWVLSGNTQEHTVRLIDAATLMVVRSVILVTTGKPIGFNYVTLSSPLTLSANKTYYLTSAETFGADMWYNSTTQVNSAPDGTVNSGVYRAGSVYNADGGAGQSFGPVNFKYTVVAPTQTPTPTPTPTPSGNAPIIFNHSETARPGDVISIQGENFGTNPQVLLGATPLAIVNKVGTGWLAAQIPTNATGALTVVVKNGSLSSAPISLNAAIPLHLDALEIVPGGAVRLFGSNLKLTGYTPSVTFNGLPASINYSVSNEHMLVLTVPNGLTGNNPVIAVDNGNGSGPSILDRQITVATGSMGDPFGLGVGWGAAFSAFSGNVINAASDPRLQSRAVCNGSNDDTQAIRGAMDLARSLGGGVVNLPSGTCRLTGTVDIWSRTVLQGAGKDQTNLRYEANYPIYAEGRDLLGIRNLSITNIGAVVEGPYMKGNTRSFIKDIRLNEGTSHQTWFADNTNMVVSGSDFIQLMSVGNQGIFLFSNSSGLVFSGNTVKWMGGAPSFVSIHDAYVFNNHFTRDGSYQNNLALTGTVHQFVLDFAYRLALVGNTFDVVNGPITNKTRNDGETILTEGGGAHRTENLGTVTSATTNSITDVNNTFNLNPFGTGLPENYGVVIVSGKGAGQTRRVVSGNSNTLTVDQAWDVVPDGTSKYASFVYGLEQSLIQGNTLSQNPRGIWLYHTAIRDVEVIDNSFLEDGGIYLRSYQKLSDKMFQPIYNVRIANNTITNTTGNWMSYLNIVFVNSDAKAFGIANLGIEVRDNHIVANIPNVDSAYEEYAAGEGYMNMMRVENYDGYESMTTPRILGTIFQRNSCTNCATAFKVGTGAGGTTIIGNVTVNLQKLVDDWKTTVSNETSVNTVVLP